MLTILFKDLYVNGYTETDLFSRLDRTLYTLLVMMTLDGWSEITQSVIAVYPWAWIPLVSASTSLECFQC